MMCSRFSVVICWACCAHLSEARLIPDHSKILAEGEPYGSQELDHEARSYVLKGNFRLLASLLAFMSPTSGWQALRPIGRPSHVHGTWKNHRRGVPFLNVDSPEVAQMDEDEVAKKLAALRKKGARKIRPKVRPAITPQPQAVSAGGDAKLPSDKSAAGQKEGKRYAKLWDKGGWKKVLVKDPLPYTEDSPVWPVPEEFQMPGAEPISSSSYGHHVSLESLFPGTGLADAWDNNTDLRHDIRVALRNDLKAPLGKYLKSDSQREAALSLDGGCKVPWFNALLAVKEGKVSLGNFTEAFKTHGVDLDGETFLRKLGELVGDRPSTGQLHDAVPLKRKKNFHMWHQMNGLPQNIVLLGFPLESGYVGGGVFSNFIKISHRLKPTQGDQPGERVEYREMSAPSETAIPDEYVFRPVYSKGREVWVSSDATHLYAEPPDRQRRQSIWRFM